MKRLIVLRLTGATRLDDVVARVAGTDLGAELLVIDETDDSNTSDGARDAARRAKISVLVPEHRYGPGGAQKVAFRYAIQCGMEAVAFMEMDRSDLPFAPFLPLFEAIETRGADFSFAIAGRSALSPWRTLSNALHRLTSGNGLPEWTARYRAFRATALSRVAFELNTNRGHFSTELVLELLDQAATWKAVPIENEGRRLYAPPSVDDLFHALTASLKYRLQRYNLFYDVRFYPELFNESVSPKAAAVYGEKPGSFTPHAFLTESKTAIPEGAAVLDIGCSSGYTARRLASDRGCRVSGVDNLPAEMVDDKLFEYHRIDIERFPAEVAALLERSSFDAVLLLDVLEHLASPEAFLLTLRKARLAKPPRFFMSTGNVAFIVIRMMLLFGFFNYGRKGILDITHKRLFSFRTFKNLLEQTGFLVVNRRFFPLPFTALGFSPRLARPLETVNRALIRLAPSLFAYQMMYEAVPLASAEEMLRDALSTESSRTRKSVQSME